MYSEKQNVLQLVALLKAHGIRQVVLSPGSRNSPLIHSFASDQEFTCYRVVDERSAGFFALGIIQATNQPVAVCCTSGTAVLNLGSAVAEAFYQQLPLLVITADRPEAWIGQMDGQTIPQRGVFQGIVRHSVQLPQINNPEEAWYANRLINEAILSLDNLVKGPTHINIPLAEPLFGFAAEELPAVRVVRQSRPTYALHPEDLYGSRFGSYERCLIVVGQLPYENELSSFLSRISQKTGAVILAEHLSNTTCRDFPYFDTALYAASDEERQRLTPDLLITIGGHIVSKRLKQFLRCAEITEHWHVSPAGEIADTFQQVTEIIRSDEISFLRYLSEVVREKTTRAYFNSWEDVCAPIEKPDVVYSDLYAVGALLHQLPEKAVLHLANSNSVRLAQMFPFAADIQVCCNRGTSGIDGSLSTAVGFAAASKKQTFLLIGDLSFFYDMNGLWNRHIGTNLHILLNNNGGGEIFHLLPGLNQSEQLDGYIAAGHQTEAKAWAEQQGFLYLAVTNMKELNRQLPLFVSEMDRPVLMEVFSDIDQNTEVIRSYYHQQKNKSKAYGNKSMEND